MHAGDVVEVGFGVPEGSEPGFVRPAVVIAADLILAAGPRTLHVVPITSNTSRSLPTEVPVSASGPDRTPVAQCHLCTILRTQRVTPRDAGSIGAGGLAQVRSVLADILDIP
ncbi:hypothetical protein BH20ACT1_BH20ACT1_03650 [soil metagenome]